MLRILVLLPVIFFGLLIIGFIMLIFKLISGSKSSYWKGVVTEKKYNQKRDFDDSKKIEHYYHLVVKTEEDKEIKVGLSAEIYDKFEVGDKIEKPKGKLFPNKI